MEPLNDDFFMKQAFGEAEKAFRQGEVPVGAVVVMNGQVIARAHNLTEKLNDVTAHAEMQAITMAANYLGGKYLNDSSMYVTLEPCAMCAAALGWSHIGRLIYGAADPKKGFQITGSHLLHPRTEVSSGILSEPCRQLLQKFFQSKRK